MNRDIYITATIVDVKILEVSQLINTIKCASQIERVL